MAVPTARPRYQVTDTGSVREMLDGAAQAWPDVRDRKALLLRLAEAGAAQLAREREQGDALDLRRRQVEATERARSAVDLDVLLGDEAWR